MNILIISHEYPPVGGGGANACKNLAKQYANKGHKVTIVTVAYINTPYEEVIDGVRIIRLRARRTKADTSSFYEMLSYLLAAYRCTDKLCKNETFDICQVFFGIPSGPIALYLKRKYKLPYVVRFGGGDIPGTQKRFDFVYKLLSPAIRIIWKNAKYLVANSEELRQKALEYENRYDVSIITNGVDTEYYKRQNVYDASDDIRMIFVSRLIERKGLQYVIPRMNEIVRKSGKRVTLTVVGDGPYKENLQNLMDDTNRDLVNFVGRKTGKDLLNLYEQSNLFILPSAWEGMPNVVLEAMAMGLPIVMTNCGGSKELIVDNGMIANIDSFVDAIIDLTSNENKMQEYSLRSRERIEELFGWSIKADEYLELFKSIG